jgi:hypothetical protein
MISNTFAGSLPRFSQSPTFDRADFSVTSSWRRSPMPSFHRRLKGSVSTRFPPDSADCADAFARLLVFWYSRSHALRFSAASSGFCGASCIPAA